MQSSVVKAAYWLHLADDDRRASQFFRQAAEGEPAATRAALAQMAIDLGRPQIGIRISKDAAADGIILPDQYYPLHCIAEATGRCRPSSRWRSRGRNPSSTPAPPRAPGRAG